MSSPKGTRDLYGEKAQRKKRIMLSLHETFSAYGYGYFETPSFESFETLTAKFAGGEEIISEIFRFQDRGERDLALRFDHTVPLGRFVAEHPELPLPFKRFAIGSSFRDGPIKTGRLREFTQADADIVGCKGVEAELELLRLAADVFTDLDIAIDLRFNHRVLLESLVRSHTDVDVESVILTLDKLEKQGRSAVHKELEAKGVATEAANELLESLMHKNPQELLASFKDPRNAEALVQAVDDVRRILAAGIPGVRFDLSLARGLNYYTGLVYEAFDATGSFSSALAAGGRYGDLIGHWRSEPLEATGISFGVDAILESGLYSAASSEVSIHIVPLASFDDAFSIAHVLRREGVRVSIDVVHRGLSKNLKYADAIGCTHALIVGEKELESGSFTLKNLSSGEQQSVSIEQLVRMFTEQVL